MSAFTVGGAVRHKARPEWGVGEVVAIDDRGVRVRFGGDERTFSSEHVDGLLDVTSEAPQPRPSPPPRTQRARVKCAACGGTLRSGTVYRDGKRWKSCPECSGDDGSEHVLLPYPDAFGTTEGRASEEMPDGAQSWCAACRPPKTPQTASKRRCSSFTAPAPKR